MIERDTENLEVEKLETGIDGLDVITEGGIPRARSTLVAGTSGSAKTVLAFQYLVEGARRGEPGLFITFEESPDELRRNMAGLGFEVARLEDEGLLGFLDASPLDADNRIIIGNYDLGALFARIEHGVKRLNAQRVALDPVGGLFHQLDRPEAVRNEVLRVVRHLSGIGVTTVVTAERTDEYGPISRWGVEEFVVDNVIVLRNVLEDEKRRRTIEVVKMRGANHQRGEFPFTIHPGDGAMVMPLSAISLTQPSTNVRISSGVDELDAMCGGGWFRDSIILISGATGTGKTLTSMEFIAGGARQGETCLLYAFEESPDQLRRNATSWGKDLAAFTRDGKLHTRCIYPEQVSLEEVLVRLKKDVDLHRPDRIAFDSLSALERVATPKGFREFVLSVTSFLKERQITGLFTATTSTTTGSTSVSERHISTITDAIVLLRYVDVNGQLRRGLVVLKMRGSAHEKNVREYSIDDTGMHVGRPFRAISGIIAGTPIQAHITSVEALSDLWQEPEPGA